MSGDNGVELPLRVGDIIELNSGGPRMLIVDIAAAGTIIAAWRDSSGMASEGSFLGRCVHRIDLI